MAHNSEEQIKQVEKAKTMELPDRERPITYPISPEGLFVPKSEPCDDTPEYRIHPLSAPS